MTERPNIADAPVLRLINTAFCGPMADNCKARPMSHGRPRFQLCARPWPHKDALPAQASIACGESTAKSSEVYTLW